MGGFEEEMKASKVWLFNDHLDLNSFPEPLTEREFPTDTRIQQTNRWEKDFSAKVTKACQFKRFVMGVFNMD
jgi:hypothetical protein